MLTAGFEFSLVSKNIIIILYFKFFQQAAGGPGGLPGVPPGAPGLPPSLAGLQGMPPSSAAGLLSLAGHGIMPPTSIQQLMARHGAEMKEDKSPLAAMEERLKHSSSASPASRYANILC